MVAKKGNRSELKIDESSLVAETSILSRFLNSLYAVVLGIVFVQVFYFLPAQDQSSYCLAIFSFWYTLVYVQVLDGLWVTTSSFSLKMRLGTGSFGDLLWQVNGG